MRTATSFSQPLRGGMSASALDFARMRMQDRLNTAHEYPSGQVMEVAHTDGTVPVQGKVGWFYAKLLHPSGPPTIMQVATSVGKDNKPRVKLKKGMVIMPRRTGEGALTYYWFDGQPPSVPTTKAAANSPCIGIPTPDGGGPPSEYCAGNWYQFAGSTPDTLWPAVQGTAPVIPSQPANSYPAEAEDDGFNMVDPQNIPVQSHSYPLQSRDGDLWRDDYNIIRRYKSTPVGHWDIITMPTSAIATDYWAAMPLVKGQVVAICTGRQRYCEIASCDNLSQRGRIVGVMFHDAANKTYCTAQSYGEFYFLNTWDKGATLYLGRNGQLTTTPPDERTGNFVKKMGRVIDYTRIQIDMRDEYMRLPAPSYAGIEDLNIHLWLRADELTLTDGDPVTYWPDKSIYDNDGLGSGSHASYVAAALNGLGVVRFNPSYSGGWSASPLELPDFTMPEANRPHFITMLINADTFTSPAFGEFVQLIGSGDANDTDALDHVNVVGVVPTDGTHNALTNKWQPHNYTAAGGVTPGSWIIVTLTYDPSVGRKFYINGIPIDTNSDVLYNGIGKFCYLAGAYNDSGAPFSGYIAEVIVGHTSPSSDALDAIHAYLNLKWAL